MACQGFVSRQASPSLPESSGPGSRRQKAFRLQAALLEPFTRPAGAEVFSAQLLGQFLVDVYDPHATLHLRLGREAPAPFAHRLEKTAGVRGLASP